MLRTSADRLYRILLVALLSLATGTAVSHVVVPQPQAVKGDSCVEPVDEMRRYHMRMLMHQRDDTVIRGIRTPQHSLVGCVGCHAAQDEAGAYVRIDEPGQFCSTCHEYAAVKMDCFQCHSAVPMSDDTALLERLLESEKFATGDVHLPGLYSATTQESRNE